jgi:muramoyltetrapeptide carboxypeptidase
MIANKLKMGDTIGIVCPSHIAAMDKYERNISILESLGFRVKCGENIYKNTYGYLASEQERADDFNKMVWDDQVKMVLFGGGEGGNELLPYLDYSAISKNPKIFCSYSDGTTILNAICARTGLVTYYGQAPGTFYDLRYYDYKQFISNFVEGRRFFSASGKWHTLSNGCCEGVLIGGYTRNFALLQGSSYFSFDARKQYVLFLEDHEKFSDIAAVSSYISHIEQSELIHRVSGLIFGHYSETMYPNLLDRLERFGRKYQLPVVYCDDFGHGVNHAILPVGIPAKLDANQQTLCFDVASTAD